jgi:WD40 repeat protein
VTRVLEILESQRPKDGEADLRGFEWYYLWRLCHSERLTIDDDTGDHVRGVAFSPNAQRLVSANSSGVVKIWDAGTGREVRRFTWGGQGECIAMALSSNGQLVALGGIGLMTVCETATGRRLVYRDPTVERNSVNAIAFSPDSKRLALATNKDWVFILDAVTGRQQLAVRHEGIVSNVAFSPDGLHLVSAGVDKTVRLWDANTGRMVRTLEGHGEGVSCVAFSPDGQQLASASRDRTIKLWDAGTGRLVLTLRGHTSGVLSAAFSPDGQTIVSAGYDGTVRIWELASGKEARTFLEYRGQILGQVNRVVFSPDGRLVASGGTGGVTLWDAVGDNQVTVVEGHPHPVSCLAFSPDSKRLASGSAQSGGKPGDVRVWEVATGQQELLLKGHAGEIDGISFSPDGNRLVAFGRGTAVRRGEVAVWDATTGQRLFSLTGFQHRLKRAAFSRDGQYVVCLEVGWSDDSTQWVSAWDPATGQQQDLHPGEWRTATGDEIDARSDAALSPDGRRLAVGSPDVVKVCDAVTGHELLHFQRHTNVVGNVAFSPDGQCLAFGRGETIAICDASLPTPEVFFQRDAFRLVDSLFSRLVQKAAVLDDLRRDTKLSEPLRREALARAGRYIQDAERLDKTSWQLVSKKGSDPALYRRASLHAQEACRLEPANADHLVPLSVAAYRLGHHREALDLLRRYLQRTARSDKNSTPGDTAGVPQAGNGMNPAQVYLACLRDILKESRWWTFSGPYSCYLQAEAELQKMTEGANKRE